MLETSVRARGSAAFRKYTKYTDNGKKNKFYVTTAIPYANAAPHIGFALEAVQADVIARHRRLAGDDVFCDRQR